VTLSTAAPTSNHRHRAAAHPVRLGRLRATRGFTLAEMVMTMAIAAVVSVIVFPSARTLMNEHRLDTAANQFGLELMRARTTAIAQSTEVRVVFTAGGYIIEARDVSTRTWEHLGGVHSLPPPVNITEAATRKVQFESTGAATPNHILLSNGRITKLVTVNRLGFVKVS